MLYNFNGTWINLAEIIAIETGDSGDPQYPFNLRVRLRIGDLVYGVKYPTKSARDKEADKISREAERYYLLHSPKPVTCEDMKYAIQRETDKIRRDIREFRRLVMEREVNSNP